MPFIALAKPEKRNNTWVQTRTTDLRTTVAGFSSLHDEHLDDSASLINAKETVYRNGTSTLRARSIGLIRIRKTHPSTTLLR